MIYATQTLALSEIALSEINQLEKANTNNYTYMSHLVKIMESRKLLDRVQEEKELESYYLMGIELQFYKMKRTVEMMVMLVL